MVELVRQWEAEGHCPQANYAFDNGVLTVALTRLIEQGRKHWVSEIECSRHINWGGRWRRVDEVATALRTQHPESFRPVVVNCRNGHVKQYWAFTKVVRLKKYGAKRLVIVHELEALQDSPRFLLTDAKHWESTRIIETWSYRWTAEVFHEFDKQVCGMEAAQVRKEEAVIRHFRLGSDIHVMLALCCRSRQVVMANEELNGTDMVGELLGKRQRCAYQTRNALSQRVVEALDVIRFPRKFGDRAVLCRRNHLLIHDILICIKRGILTVGLGNLGP